MFHNGSKTACCRSYLNLEHSGLNVGLVYRLRASGKRAPCKVEGFVYARLLVAQRPAFIGLGST